MLLVTCCPFLIVEDPTPTSTPETISHVCALLGVYNNFLKRFVTPEADH